jgi:hypothetical protein
MKTYKIVKTDYNKGRSYEYAGTLLELIDVFAYTLDVGFSYQHEKGNKKINCNPKTIKSLITNLNNASNNAARNGYSGVGYEYEDIVE